MYATVYEGQKRTLGIVSFHLVGPKYWTQVVILVDKHFSHWVISGWRRIHASCILASSGLRFWLRYRCCLFGLYFKYFQPTVPQSIDIVFVSLGGWLFYSSWWLWAQRSNPSVCQSFFFDVSSQTFVEFLIQLFHLNVQRLNLSVFARQIDFFSFLPNR